VGVDDDWKEHAERDHDHLRCLADPQPQDDERQERDLRNGIGGGDERISDRPQGAR
jgi:hypothetical protein